jgi:hypothetical protein
MDILDDKVRHEQEMRILNEKHDASNKEIAEIYKLIVKQNAIIIKKLDKIAR